MNFEDLKKTYAKLGLELRKNADGTFYTIPLSLSIAGKVTAHVKKAPVKKVEKKVLLVSETDPKEVNIEVAVEENGNANLRKAARAKNDEFYTRYEDIQDELQYYKEFLKGKIIYCPCDKFIENGRSQFVNYFVERFEELELKKVMFSYFDQYGHGHFTTYEGDRNGNGIVDEEDFVDIALAGDGSFDSYECRGFMKECDVVVTNPPFSLFRAFVKQIVELHKKFIIIGNVNAITFKEIIPLIKNNQMWTGVSSFNKGMYFKVPDDYEYADTYKFAREINGEKVMRVSSICWFTNFDIDKRREKFPLSRKYEGNEKYYPKYDNYDAIEVSKAKNIPYDYKGIMGVPISFLDKYCPEQFEIVGGFNGYKECDTKSGVICGNITEYVDSAGKIKTWTGPTVNKKPTYFRILIRHK